MSGFASSSPSSSSSASITSNHEAYWIDSSGTAHERCRLLVFVRDKFLGEAPLDPGETPELGWRRGGVAFFCSTCGEIWGRLVLVNSQGKQTSFDEVSRVACEQHWDQWEVSGSFLGGYRNEGYLKYLPPKAVVREFLVNYNALMKE